MSDFNLRDKVVLITGASGGIGAAMARALHAEGAQLVLTDVARESIDGLANEFEPEHVLPLALDVTDMDACRSVVAQAVERFGGIDVVLANAGIAWDPPKTVATAPVDEFERIIEVDLLGVWRTVRAALPEVRKAQGHILVTASVYAFANGMVNAPYAMSKAGVEQLGRALRAELAGTGTTAGVLYPGWVDTPLIKPAFGGHAIATEIIQTLFPKALRTPVPPERVADAVVKGLRRRAPRTIVPRRFAPFSLLRGLFNMLSDALLDRHKKIQDMIRRLEKS